MQDRLAELRKKRGQRENTERETSIFLKIHDEEKSEEPLEDALRPHETIKRNILLIKANTERLHLLTSQAAKASSEDENKRINVDLSEISDETIEVIKSTQEYINTSREENDTFSQKNEHSASSATFRKNMLTTHTRHFRDVTTKYHDQAQKLKKAMENKERREIRIVKPDITDDEVEEIIERGASEYLKDQMMMSAGMIDRVAQIEARHEGILKIEEGVRELQGMFNDLAFLVEMQQEKLDNIEHNIDQTFQNVGSAVKNIKVAEEHGKKARKWQCWAMMCCLILLLIILLPTLLTTLGSA